MESLHRVFQKQGYPHCKDGLVPFKSLSTNLIRTDSPCQFGVCTNHSLSFILFSTIPELLCSVHRDLEISRMKETEQQKLLKASGAT